MQDTENKNEEIAIAVALRWEEYVFFKNSKTIRSSKWYVSLMTLPAADIFQSSRVSYPSPYKVPRIPEGHIRPGEASEGCGIRVGSFKYLKLVTVGPSGC